MIDYNLADNQVRLCGGDVPDDATDYVIVTPDLSLASLPRFFEALAPESCRLPFRKSDQEHVDSVGDPAEHLDCGNLVHHFESGHKTCF